MDAIVETQANNEVEDDLYNDAIEAEEEVGEELPAEEAEGVDANEQVGTGEDLIDAAQSKALNTENDPNANQENTSQKPESDGTEGKMFIGGLSWNTTKETLQSYFGKYGEIVDSVIMMTPGGDRSRGFGFLTFADPKSVEKVMGAGPHTIDERTIDPKPAVPQRAIRRDSERPLIKTMKIFVGGLSPETTEESLTTFFGKFGKVDDVVIMKDKFTQRLRGFGFVSFTEASVVDTVVQKQYYEVDGKEIEVKKAEPRSDSNRPGGFQSGGRGGYGGGYGGNPSYGGSSHGQRGAGGYQSGGYGGQSSYGGGKFGASSRGGSSYGGGRGGHQNGGSSRGGGYDSRGSRGGYNSGYDQYGQQSGGGGWGADPYAQGSSGAYGASAGGGAWDGYGYGDQSASSGYGRGAAGGDSARGSTAGYGDSYGYDQYGQASTGGYSQGGYDSYDASGYAAQGSAQGAYGAGYGASGGYDDKSSGYGGGSSTYSSGGGRGGSSRDSRYNPYGRS
ncbi:hypothetical protein SARC_02328 [Sphaeroforma arctica JP610]|uniref:RRM domain-containing protein n=1 Tax=Sphaeroforma arctica JP610 TaxID=667725 RepID=A0A0L0G9C5_9EUKA|nr:hypothetical protein SARC_02328 [Sphaeroforma arctica JP610]KNC85491.1 hypothetical protein SARC_02328 [Sphaeroforma arctica JP610]|eukprot:XP_014159393.1 hypothetical protein SARC_02328 [Sphaeroforma arctica JP610]